MNISGFPNPHRTTFIDRTLYRYPRLPPGKLQCLLKKRGLYFTIQTPGFFSKNGLQFTGDPRIFKELKLHDLPID
jgi:hypothetical protein